MTLSTPTATANATPTATETAATPHQAGFSVPAEWSHHDCVWLAWPSHGDLWQENLKPAQEEFVSFCREVADLDPNGDPRGERLRVLVPTLEAGAEAERRLHGLPVSIHLIPFGDIWLRDTSAIFATNAKKEKAFVRFGFNGWGGKFDLDHDPELALEIGKASGYRGFEAKWILEGGSVELDGEGTCLTSRQCLLNENRNPGLTETEIEANLKEWLGVQKVLWVNEGLVNDHTDGHIDTIARFSAPGVVLCMQAKDSSDPNHEIYETIARDLSEMTDAKGRKLKVVRIPSPGAVLNEDGDIMPASYLNFYIANSTVVVPTYGAPQDDAAVKAIAACFPNRRTVGVSGLAILSGGGAFHCMSQQEPSV